MIENEYKVLISYAKYEELKKNQDFKTKIKQKNYYYDTKEHELLNKGITVRIREFTDAKKYLQIKQKIKHNLGTFTSKNEYEEEILFIPKFLNLQDIFRKINYSFDSEESKILLLGELETTRRKLTIGNSVLYLDKNKYCSIEDYEVEIEFNEDFNEPLEILKKLNISYKTNCVGKYRRFVNQLNKKKIQFKSKL